MFIEKIEENEQWRLAGDCTKCRRSGYCSKPCTRCNYRKRTEIFRLTADMISTIVEKAISESARK
jgi:hypothetical protein